MEPHLFQALEALVGLVQLVDDLLDWKDDWAARRPTCVTAYLSEPPSQGANWRDPILLHAGRLNSLLIAASRKQVEALPLAAAGAVVWTMALALLHIRLPR